MQSCASVRALASYLRTRAVDACQQYLLVHVSTIFSFVMLQSLRECLVEGIDINPRLFSQMEGPVVKLTIAYSTPFEEPMSRDKVLARRPRAGGFQSHSVTAHWAFLKNTMFQTPRGSLAYSSPFGRPLRRMSSRKVAEVLN